MNLKIYLKSFDEHIYTINISHNVYNFVIFFIPVIAQLNAYYFGFNG